MFGKVKLNVKLNRHLSSANQELQILSEIKTILQGISSPESLLRKKRM